LLQEEELKSMEEKKNCVKGIGRKKTNESEHFTWKDDIKVPCGRLVPSDKEDSPIEYNEYAVYDPKQVRNHKSKFGFGMLVHCGCMG
jgi:poly [ADP-ribose] polymerase 2/3/4